MKRAANRLGAAKKIIRRLVRKQQQRHNATRTKNKRGPVGTEARAIASLEKNNKAFDYPSEGFVTKVEYSLLYNMIEEPTIYPEETVLNQIADEDFTEYMIVNSTSPTRQRSYFEEENEDEVVVEERIIHYGQLSAILALASEKYPSSSKNRMNSLSLAESLSKVVLKIVIDYVEENNLDRESELKDLMDPVERHFIKRDNKHQLKSNLPFYIGYTATVLTLNPLPMLLGATIMCGSADKMSTERKNIENIANDTQRRADVEKTSLLDEKF
mmetsp:Transcript_25749/g.29431  ORF Transcript_25749/g.29431 Transcript_25749/m.29431 type:complete len:271 (-) Transcript_25749:128-940(-)|eukprot:CAMPEP_0194131632 /NCGR_PEP_ID=MMETSP0152-20130528/2366_1 /TAXON_ID=1049557 /ORGANISM="Thalassiothrix antarctica, Strain L6-D1" /LENGTH=270 /DNA_ID=CAMNT_0038826481 /DNA_START=202 /DNA_END=1014 /DNA_ORIENTATION=-